MPSYTFFTSQVKDLYVRGIHKLSSQCQTCLERAVDYVKKWGKPLTLHITSLIFSKDERLKLWQRSSSSVADIESPRIGRGRSSEPSNGSRLAAHGLILLWFVFLHSVYPKEEFEPKFFLKLTISTDFRRGGYLLIGQPSHIQY